jgi:Na+/H+ antiporter NhaD/arsenite permease-like protein
MELAVIIIFVIGYGCIAFEHSISINKTATALITGILCWTVFILSRPGGELLSSELYFHAMHALESEMGSSAFASLSASEVFHRFVLDQLSHHIAVISEILFFLLGAMTIVELIDAHQGFRFLTNRIKTKNPKALLWIICWIAFFLSAVLDNLTTAIVMVSLIRKLIPDRQMRLFFAGMIVIASNAGGAWSPIGDVTTTMLWINGQVSAVNIIKTLLLPSIVCLLVPLFYINFSLKWSRQIISHQDEDRDKVPVNGKIMLFIGMAALISVPVFKMYTHLPPYIGVLLGLGILWIVSEIINPGVDDTERKQFTAAGALSRIDVPSILFFLGILLAIGALESMLVLDHVSKSLAAAIGDQRIIITLVGIFSAVVDNVPLVAASMSMYSLDQFPQDSFVWEYLAYCAGTGGSLLIIGSAAGVAVMGIEKVDFLWYLKKITWIAFLGYAAGAVVYIVLQPFLS